VRSLTAQTFDLAGRFGTEVTPGGQLESRPSIGGKASIEPAQLRQLRRLDHYLAPACARIVLSNLTSPTLLARPEVRNAA
jgi:hypothetical protein